MVALVTSTLSAVCIVPPEAARVVWTQVTRARTEQKDPGLFRWPPHVNLLYPFVTPTYKKTTEVGGGGGQEYDDLPPEILHRLHTATKYVEPFTIQLDQCGTFGGKNRGVLWFNPRSYYPTNDEDTIHTDNQPNEPSRSPLHILHDRLEEAFPECLSSKPRQPFHPHMTVSHFGSLDDAENAKTHVESWWPTDGMSFDLKEIYVLQRNDGDDGQFMKVATIGLGQHSSIQTHDPCVPFHNMPSIEEEWVRAERMALKLRRKGTRRNRNKQSVSGCIQ